MARTRLLKPGFFKDAELLELSPLHRLLFAGLWTLADRAGRLKDKPKEIRLELLPRDECDVDRMLTDLAVAGFLCRYEAGGKKLIQIRTFEGHQKPHRNEPASTLPGIDGVTSDNGGTTSTIGPRARAVSASASASDPNTLSASADGLSGKGLPQAPEPAPESPPPPKAKPPRKAKSRTLDPAREADVDEALSVLAKKPRTNIAAEYARDPVRAALARGETVADLQLRFRGALSSEFWREQLVETLCRPKNRAQLLELAARLQSTQTQPRPKPVPYELSYTDADRAAGDAYFAAKRKKRDEVRLERSQAPPAEAEPNASTSPEPAKEIPT